MLNPSQNMKLILLLNQILFTGDKILQQVIKPDNRKNSYKDQLNHKYNLIIKYFIKK